MLPSVYCNLPTYQLEKITRKRICSKMGRILRAAWFQSWIMDYTWASYFPCSPFIPMCCGPLHENARILVPCDCSYLHVANFLNLHCETLQRELHLQNGDLQWMCHYDGHLLFHAFQWHYVQRNNWIWHWIYCMFAHGTSYDSMYGPDALLEYQWL